MWDQFDEKTSGCPLVALKKTCVEMRVSKNCPKFLTLMVVDNSGVQSLKGVCADVAVPILLWEAAGGITRVQAAIESSRNDQVKGIAGLGNILVSMIRRVNGGAGPDVIEGSVDGDR